jgi:hypothetical protein
LACPGTAFEKVLRQNEPTISEYLEVDDSDVLFHVKQWQRSSDEILRTSANDSLLAGCSRRSISICRKPSDPVSISCKRVHRQGWLRSDYYFIEDRASDVPYYNYYTAEGASRRAGSMWKTVLAASHT